MKKFRKQFASQKFAYSFLIGGEYRYLPYSVPPSPICDFYAKDPYFYQYFANHSDFPSDIAANCPLVPVRTINQQR